VPESLTIVIAASDLLPTLKERTTQINGEVLAFSDTEAVRALEAIVKRRPSVVALEKAFAGTPRGVALINRIKADPALVELEIRLVTHDTDYSRVLPRQGARAAAAPVLPDVSPAAPERSAFSPFPTAPAAIAEVPDTAPIVEEPEVDEAPAESAPEIDIASAAAAIAEEPIAEPLDQRGTRRAKRYRISPPLDVMVDGNTATLVDLSKIGAQVVSTAALKPNQRVRLGLTDDRATVRVNGRVALASFEIPPKLGPRYRAGIEFVAPDQAAIEAFAKRHT
jgi:hypothetical protein